MIGEKKGDELLQLREISPSLYSSLASLKHSNDLFSEKGFLLPPGPLLNETQSKVLFGPSDFQGTNFKYLGPMPGCLNRTIIGWGGEGRSEAQVLEVTPIFPTSY